MFIRRFHACVIQYRWIVSDEMCVFANDEKYLWKEFWLSLCFSLTLSAYSPACRTLCSLIGRTQPAEDSCSSFSWAMARRAITLTCSALMVVPYGKQTLVVSPCEMGSNGSPTAPPAYNNVGICSGSASVLRVLLVSTSWVTRWAVTGCL